MDLDPLKKIMTNTQIPTIVADTQAITRAKTLKNIEYKLPEVWVTGLLWNLTVLESFNQPSWEPNRKIKIVLRGWWGSGKIQFYECSY